jgi:hypothetical protein
MHQPHPKTESMLNMARRTLRAKGMRQWTSESTWTFVQLEMPHDSPLHELVDNLILTKIGQRPRKDELAGKGPIFAGCARAVTRIGPRMLRC